ncbi:hypothetical protein HK102_000759 [Quaeritorhiza haematococci]|nr:hypothetical protein HK102_000759 [Quaeritorhiza haematococci]
MFLELEEPPAPPTSPPTSDRLCLNCLLDTHGERGGFTIEVEKATTVGLLRLRIAEFYRMPTEDLDLWKCMTPNEPPKLRKAFESLKPEDKLSPSQSLSELFPASPDSHMIHVLAKLVDRADSVEESSVDTTLTTLTTAVEELATRTLQKALYIMFRMGICRVDDSFHRYQSKTLDNDNEQAKKLVAAYYGSTPANCNVNSITSNGYVDLLFYLQRPPFSFYPSDSDDSYSDVRVYAFGQPQNHNGFRKMKASFKHRNSRPYNISISHSSPNTDVDVDITTSSQESSSTRPPQTIFYYGLFESTYRNGGVLSTVDQLERRLAYLVFKFHGSKVPHQVIKEIHARKNDWRVGNWLSAEVQRLVGLAGWVVEEYWTRQMEQELKRKIFQNQGYHYPCLWTLWREGRLLFLEAYDLGIEQRIAILEQELEEVLQGVKIKHRAMQQRLGIIPAGEFEQNLGLEEDSEMQEIKVQNLTIGERTDLIEQKHKNIRQLMQAMEEMVEKGGPELKHDF